MMEEEINLNRGTVKISTEDLGMREVSAKMAPQILSDNQKLWWLDVCSDLFYQLAKGNKFLCIVTKGDESWYLQYDLEVKCQSTQWKTPTSRLKKGKHAMSPSEDNADLLFDHKGIVHSEFPE
jgi:hypothetical protein